MRYTPVLGLLAAVCAAAPARAEVIVNTPWVTIHVGRPLPPPQIIPGDLPPVPIPPPVTTEPLPLPPPVPIPPPVTTEPLPLPPPAASIGVRPPTLQEFAQSFRPAPGRYEVVLLNPATGCPTKVCFTLPCDRPCKVKVHSRSLEFSYGLCNKVTIRFKHDGEVTVRD